MPSDYRSRTRLNQSWSTVEAERCARVFCVRRGHAHVRAPRAGGGSVAVVCVRGVYVCGAARARAMRNSARKGVRCMVNACASANHESLCVAMQWREGRRKSGGGV